MLRAELQAVIDALTDKQITVLTTARVVDAGSLEAMVQQSNAKDTKANQAAAAAAAELMAVQDKLDTAVKQAPVDQQTAVDAATDPLIAQIAALTQQVADQKATLDKYDVLLAAKDAGPLADKLKKQAMVDTLTQQMSDAQAAHDKAAKDLAELDAAVVDAVPASLE